MQVCAEPGCPELTDQTYCTTHARDRDARRPGRHARGYDARWRHTRRRYLATHPHCEEPRCAARATEVHHRDGLGPSGPRGHDADNLEALCKRHHSQRTARDQRAGTAAWRSAP